MRLVISDAHEGLKTALDQVLTGATWQRCRVHCMRNILAHVTRVDRSMVAAALRTIFAQPDRASAGQQLALVADSMAPRWPKAAEVLRAAEEDVLAYMGFPSEHWTRLYSTNPLERLNVGSTAAAKSGGALTWSVSSRTWRRWSAWWGPS